MKKSMRKIRYRVLALCVAVIILLGTLVPEIESQAAVTYNIRVNVAANVVTIYQNGVAVKAMLCSTGPSTPVSGTYDVGTHYRWWPLFDNVYGQYCTRITGHILFHSVPYLKNGDPSSLEYDEYDKLGTSASLGCIRLTVADAKWIYDNCFKSNATVTFYMDAANPGPLGVPTTQKITSSGIVMRGWDPTDPDPNNPWTGGNGVPGAAEAAARQAAAQQTTTVQATTAQATTAQATTAQAATAQTSTVQAESAAAATTALMGNYDEVFDPVYYYTNYPDLQAAFGNDEAALLRHWLVFGINEGRKGNAEFDLTVYKNNYADLRDAFGENDLLYIQHYILAGKAEGRIAK